MTVSRTCPTCGYRHSYRSAAVADAHHARHSCDYQQRLETARAKQAARNQRRPKRDCHHPIAQHQHGTRAAYVRDRCRCRACTAANAVADHHADREKTYGRWMPYVDASAARAHIQTLREHGIGVDQIAKLAATGPSHIRELARTSRRSGGRRDIRRVRRDTADRILAIEPLPANRSPRSQIGATGTHRRLQALMAIGWPRALLAAELGRSTSNLRRAMTGATVTTRSALQVHELYERLWDNAPPQNTPAQQHAAAQARREARVRGWPPPLSWDDIDTDPDPDTDPAAATPRPDPNDVDEVAVDRAVAGDGIRLDELTPAEQAEAVRRLTERGKSIRDIAEQLSTTKRTVSRKRGAAASAA